MRTRPEYTRGIGQNTVGDTIPQRRTRPKNRAFTLGVPYSLPPGSAASRSATSACTITITTRIDGNSASRCSSAGTPTL